MKPVDMIGLVQKRDPEAYTILYKNYSEAIRAEILKFGLNSYYPSEDILQEIFTKVFQNIDQFKPEKGELYTWLINIARNYCRDLIRSKEYHNLRSTTFGQDLPDSRSIQINIDTILLKETVNILPTNLRVLIKLFYFLGMTDLQIAAMLQIPAGTVKTRIQIGLKLLRYKMSVNPYFYT